MGMEKGWWIFFPPGTQFKFKWLIYSERREWGGQKNINSLLSPLPSQFSAFSQLSVACFSYKTLNALGKPLETNISSERTVICSCQYKQKEHAVLSLGHPIRCLIFAKQAFCSKPQRECHWLNLDHMFKMLLENTQSKAMPSKPIGASTIFPFGFCLFLDQEGE